MGLGVGVGVGVDVGGVDVVGARGGGGDDGHCHVGGVEGDGGELEGREEQEGVGVWVVAGRVG